MRAWLLASRSAEGAGLERLLASAGYTVDWVPEDGLPTDEPDFIILLHQPDASWERLREVMRAHPGAPTVYFGTHPHDARRQLPGLTAALSRPITGVELRVTMQRFGIPWGLAGSDSATAP